MLHNRHNRSSALYRNLHREALASIPKTADEHPAARRITVCGSFGFGNTGDEAVPLAIADLAKALPITLRISVLSRYRRIPSPEVIGRGEQDGQRRRELRGQLLMLAGGGVIGPRRGSVMRCGQRMLHELRPSQTCVFAAQLATVACAAGIASHGASWVLPQHWPQFPVQPGGLPAPPLATKTTFGSS